MEPECTPCGDLVSTTKPTGCPCPCSGTNGIHSDAIPFCCPQNCKWINYKQNSCHQCVVSPAPPEKKDCAYVQPPIPKSFAPCKTYVPPHIKMSTRTIYNKSYTPLVGFQEPVKPFVPKQALYMKQGKISGETINRIFYTPKEVPHPKRCIPCDHDLMGKGPMNDVTTQKEHFPTQCYSKPQPFKLPSSLSITDCPFKGQSTYNSAYTPLDVHTKKVEGVDKPVDALEKPKGKFLGTSMQKMSYRPYGATKPREIPSWSKRPDYLPPKTKMDFSTIYKMSYREPGLNVCK